MLGYWGVDTPSFIGITQGYGSFLCLRAWRVYSAKHGNTMVFTVLHCQIKLISPFPAPILVALPYCQCYLFSNWPALLTVLVSWRINNMSKRCNFSNIGATASEFASFDMGGLMVNTMVSVLWGYMYLIYLIIFMTLGDPFHCHQ